MAKSTPAGALRWTTPLGARYSRGVSARPLVSVVVGLAVVASACLRKDTVSTWYLEADRTVIWVVEEREVRADAESADERDQLEDEYLASARQTNHPVARGLRQLTPSRLTARILRDRPPLHVVTEAAFPGLAQLGERVLSRLGLRGRSFVEFTREGFEWTWSLDGDARVDEDLIDEDLAALFETTTIRIALAERRFLSSSSGGFSEDRRVATFPIGDLVDGHKGDGTPTTFVLAWSAR